MEEFNPDEISVLSVKIPRELHTQLKVYCATRGCSIQSTVDAAIAAYIAQE